MALHILQEYFMSQSEMGTTATVVLKKAMQTVEASIMTAFNSLGNSIAAEIRTPENTEEREMNKQTILHWYASLFESKAQIISLASAPKYTKKIQIDPVDFLANKFRKELAEPIVDQVMQGLLFAKSGDDLNNTNLKVIPQWDAFYSNPDVSTVQVERPSIFIPDHALEKQLIDLLFLTKEQARRTHCPDSLFVPPNILHRIQYGDFAELLRMDVAIFPLTDSSKFRFKCPAKWCVTIRKALPCSFQSTQLLPSILILLIPATSLLRSN